MMTGWPSCLPISAIVLMGVDIRSFYRRDAEGDRVIWPSGHRAIEHLMRRAITRWPDRPMTRWLLRLSQLFEGCDHFSAWGFVLSAVDFEQQRGLLRRGAQQFHGLFPVDRSLARPEVRVFVFLVVVYVRRADVVLQDREAFRNAFHHVGVAAIETD